MRIDILTVLPGIVEGPLQHSILSRAQKKGLLDVHVHDLRDFSVGKHRMVDDYPYGGGAGMVMKPEPIFDCLDALRAEADADPSIPAIDEVIYLTPDGEVLGQALANALSLRERLVLLAGHYKGIDQRVRDGLVTRDISVGDYVLSGGELPALILTDAIARLLPGVLGDAESALTDAFQDDLLDAPLYTRPASYRGQDVPAVLLSGDHVAVEAWRAEKQLAKTQARRPDLLASSA